MKNHKIMITPKSRSLEINDLEDIKIIKPLMKVLKCEIPWSGRAHSFEKRN